MIYRQYAKKVHKIYSQLDRQIESFKRATGLECLDPCGQCCLNPHVEATILEMLPLSLHLLGTGQAEFWLDRIYERESNTKCIFFQNSPDTPHHGQCLFYNKRALICRLFNFSAIKNKKDRWLLVSCKRLKDSSSEKVIKAQEMIDNGLDVPKMNIYAMRIFNINVHLGSKYYPINMAFKIALETVLMRSKFFFRKMAS
ncbi:MAG: YkgJ family cysteine cluster protein [Spirochaetes bacterium]|nr:YkgJ family cysteine cluster protein [Spirochaetota bacterium]